MRPFNQRPEVGAALDAGRTVIHATPETWTKWRRVKVNGRSVDVAESWMPEGHENGKLHGRSADCIIIDEVTNETQ